MTPTLNLSCCDSYVHTLHLLNKFLDTRLVEWISIPLPTCQLPIIKSVNQQTCTMYVLQIKSKKFFIVIKKTFVKVTDQVLKDNGTVFKLLDIDSASHL